MTADRLRRTVRRQRLSIGALSGALVLTFALGQSRPEASPTVTHYAAGGDRLYRIWDDGRIDFLIADFADGSNEGIPGWAPLQIDHGFTRNRMGSIIVAPRR